MSSSVYNKYRRSTKSDENIAPDQLLIMARDFKGFKGATVKVVVPEVYGNNQGFS